MKTSINSISNSEADGANGEEINISGPFGIKPAHLFFAASVPFLLGAYNGYQKQIREFEKQSANELKALSRIEKSPTREISLPAAVDARKIATKALAIGTMLCFGGSAAICAGKRWIYPIFTNQSIDLKI
jgi:hypothetical protein